MDDTIFARDKQSDKEKIISVCKDWLKQDGYVRIGSAIQFLFGNKYTGVYLLHMRRIVRAELIKDGLYISEPVEKSGEIINYDIFPNPNHELTESVKTTNASITHLNEVTLPANFDSQKTFSNRSLYLAAFSTIFILLTVLLQYCDKTPQRLQDIKTELQNTKKSLDSIRLSVEKIDSSMKLMKTKTDTVFVKRH